ncbi:GNAT family N-acetyltransferase, partial [uncultured Nocardioides sp.]|uniref:GNAT family N-acetyltransferase n=1 Tax=uncultured Nocardioides sp. TaxID=198441 RepID=UPI0025DB3DD8
MAADFSVRAATTEDIPALASIYGREAREGYATFDVEPRSHDAWLPYVGSSAPGDLALVAVDDAH